VAPGSSTASSPVGLRRRVFVLTGLLRLPRFKACEEPAVAVEQFEMLSENLTVLYRSKMNPVLKKNFAVFPVLDWIATLTAHIPDKGEQLVRYYGYYSNVARGKRKKEKPEEKTDIREIDAPTISRELKKRWFYFIRKVYETDPLVCPKCQGEMRIISFIDQVDVIKKILQHLGLWEESHAPPESERPTCWNQKILNVLDKLPRRQQDAAKALLCQIPYAPTQREAERRRDQFVHWCQQHGTPDAARCLETDCERLMAFYRFPQPHWQHLRTTNRVESPFAAARLRTDTPIDRSPLRSNATPMLARLIFRMRRFQS
jgi:Transposase, Mutator family/Putative transposase